VVRSVTDQAALSCRPYTKQIVMADRTCIYIAAHVTEAKRVEAVLTRIGVDYALELTGCPPRLLGLFPTRYMGATFYVVAAQAHACRRALHGAGLAKGLVEEA